MIISDKMLEFQSHLDGYKKMGVLTDNRETGASWHYRAQDDHSLVVKDSINDLQAEIVMLGQKLGKGEPYNHLVFGAARRSGMIWRAFCHLHDLIPPDRKEPLLSDDVSEAARALNDIYIHIRGLLDNYARVLYLLFRNKNCIGLANTDINLFGKKILKYEGIESFKDIISNFKSWDKELKKLRNPIAHRIPLSVPPFFLNDSDHKNHAETIVLRDKAQEEFLKLTPSNSSQEQIDAAKTKVEALNDKLQKIGTFVPIIIHDPDVGGTEIYPTVPDDIGQMTKLVRELNTKITELMKNIEAT